MLFILMANLCILCPPFLDILRGSPTGQEQAYCQVKLLTAVFFDPGLAGSIAF